LKTPEWLDARLERPVEAGVWSAGHTESWKEVNRIWKSGSAVWRDPATGDFLRSPRPGAAEKRKPRIGLYRSWIPNMDEGWTRYILDQFGFEYTRLVNAEIRRGALRSRFDVIVFPKASATAMNEGFRAGQMPPEYAGGLGAEGAAALKAFAEAGGTLVFLNESSEWAIEALGLPVKNVLAGLNSREYYCPGSLLNVTLQAGHPLGYGMPAEVAIWNEGSPAFEVRSGSVAGYGEKNLLASGWLLGEKYLVKRSALADVPMGKGRAVLFGMRPQYRAQSYQAFKLLFNSFLL
jgi:hypothetical protein